MNAPGIIPPHVRAPQIAASDPGASVWVAANAGSGKTHVLAQRVIRLLLRGVAPSKILCITFTKAAAANMSMRVFNTLADWTRYDDETLDAAIEAIGDRPSDVLRATARRLFALALETPGGLKVQTIHAFCTRLLHQFPFESDVAARFTVLDDTIERQLLDRLSLDVLLEAAATPNSALGRALATAIASAADQTFRDVIGEAIGKRDEIQNWIDRAGGKDAAIAGLSQLLGIGPTDSAESVEAEFFAASHIPLAKWGVLADHLATGSKSDQEQLERLKKAEPLEGRPRINAYTSIFCTGKDERRKRIVTIAVRDRDPAFFDLLAKEQDRICALIEKRRAILCRDRSAALLMVADAVISRYRAEKDRRGLLDYDDLIDKTLHLFARTSAAWILYKLDLGIDHVLIDEAQDTSAKQWQIITTLIEEFTAGAGARNVPRSLFAVGDDKQSIFSFQGAAPLKFDAMRRHFETSFRAVDLPWRRVTLETSFRSGETILGAVDHVFSRVEAYAGLSADPVKTAHSALPDAMPGSVEIWPLIKPEGKAEIEGWDAPFDATSETSPQVQLAKKIAQHVRDSVDRDCLGSGKKPVRPGDILVLVRQRGPLFEAIIRALKQENIAVAGADRLILTEHIAIMDLIALADTLLLPEDDLALASALKSPLFGFDDDDLFKIAHSRGTLSLRASLIAHANDDRLFARAALQIEDLTDSARRDSPFAFYARLLGPLQGRKRILARLGPEAADALDEFLNLALAYETRETPSLQGFVAWLRAARAEVKRDMEISRDEVRVMTVHGAKGLEAPIVILADTTSAPAGPPQRQPKLLAIAAEQAAPGTPPLLLWAGRKETDVPMLTHAREKARRVASEEYRRLLYVALTRAIEKLVICGAEGTRQRPEGCWYDLIVDALQDQCAKVESAGGDEHLHFRKAPIPNAAPSRGDKTASANIVTLPEWLRSESRSEPRSTVAVTPSDSGEDDDARRGGDPLRARQRGILIHRLMQSLPDVPQPHRAQAGSVHLARAGQMFSATEREEMLTQVHAILDDARFASLFAPGSRAEVPIVGRLTPQGQMALSVSGQIDRLVVTEKEVLIADYKTNRPAPRHLADVPRSYIRQLSLYRALLAKIYPDRAIRTALIWTDVPDLMDIPASALDCF